LFHRRQSVLLLWTFSFYIMIDGHATFKICFFEKENVNCRFRDIEVQHLRMTPIMLASYLIAIITIPWKTYTFDEAYRNCATVYITRCIGTSERRTITCYMGTQYKIGWISKASCTKAFYYFGYERGNSVTILCTKIFEINNFVNDKKSNERWKLYILALLRGCIESLKLVLFTIKCYCKFCLSKK